MQVMLALFSYGGIEGELVDCLMAELFNASKKGQSMLYSRIHGDALISRSRSKALSAFLQTRGDILFMVDHDIQWDVGDILATCEQAHERKCIVGGMYSSRAEGMGFSGRLMKDENIRFGADAFVDARYIGGGFTAIPRVVAEETLKYGLDFAVSHDPRFGEQGDRRSLLTECTYLDGSKFYDFFRPIVVPNPDLKTNEYLSEDWSFCWRARQANPNRPQLYWTKPFLLHWGRAPFSMMRSQGREPSFPGGTRTLQGHTKVQLH